MENLRKYGRSPFGVVVIHGGPGASGEMAPVARELSKKLGILEPLQTKASIDGQIEELRDILEKNGSLPIILIGWSWGAWLAFIFAAKYPSLVTKLILVSSGSFEEKYTKDIMKTRLARLDVQEKKEALFLMQKLEDGGNDNLEIAMNKFGASMDKADSYDALSHKSEVIECQYEIYKSVWQEADKLRSAGKLLELGGKITCPVVAIHGDYDSHLAVGVKEPLEAILKDFKFILLKNCGHHPWFEKQAKDKFYEILRQELLG